MSLYNSYNQNQLSRYALRHIIIKINDLNTYITHS